MSDDQTYTIHTLMEGLESLRAQHPHFQGNTITDVVVELDGVHAYDPGDVLNIKAIKYNPLTGKVHLVVVEMDD
jgi:hypothetical protein